MKIALLAFGSRGDVQPYIALGKGLKTAGHDVSLTSLSVFEAFVREHGLGFFPLGGDPREVMLAQAVAELGNNPIKINRWFATVFKPALQDLFRETLEAARGADLLLISTLSLSGWHIAQKLRIPGISLNLQPSTPTRAFHGMMSPSPPDWVPFKGFYNYASSKLGNQIFFGMTRSTINQCRAEILDLPRLSARYYWGLDGPMVPIPMIYAFSPAVLPRPFDWGDYKQLSGYWFLDLENGYQPPTELADFLEAGPPPVYVGFGSMVDHEREKITRLIVEAVEKTGQRAILLGGWSELNTVDLPESILQIDDVPHDWLFPRVAAVVHHGGAGTTAAGLRAGAPTVIVSFFGDQFFWGWHLHKLGAGPKPIPRKKLTADRLAAAIDRAVNDAAIKQRAAELGRQIRAEDGVKLGVELVERFANAYIP